MSKEILQNGIRDCIAAIEQLRSDVSQEFLLEAAEMITSALSSGNKILIAGNGGSLCDAMHFAEELTGFFREKRPALPAIALSDPSHITCTGNDVGFDQIFSRGVEALGKSGDVFIGLSTSGNSANILLALEKGREMGLKTIAFLGKTGGKTAGFADLEWVISGFSTSDRVQEVHMAGMHLIIEMVENKLFTKTPY